MKPDSLRSIRGIGEKTEKLFGKVGVTTPDQLLHYYPREYDISEPVCAIGEVRPGEKNAVCAVIRRAPSVRTFGKTSITMLALQDESGSLQVNWFHMPFLRTKLKPGMVYVFRGLVIRKNNRLIMEHPQLFSPGEYETLCGVPQPVYALTSGLTNNMIRKSVRQVLDTGAQETEYLPPEIRSQAGLCEINFALEQIHFPEDRDTLASARKRLVFDEFFLFMLGVQQLRRRYEAAENHFPMKKVWRTEDVIDALPFRMTAGQQRVWGEIERDLAGEHLMNRMVQGDVGSGKTILAFLAMVQAFDNGYQSALMAPTEVLAAQHYQALTRLLESAGIADAHPVLLRGSCTAKEKKEISAEIAAGTARMIIGTHALIQDTVNYHDLGIVITDEQHRFGVRQRDTLEKKGYPPNVLVMSATPIPRTLSMILYGDLDISVLREMPANRLPVKNCVVGPAWRGNAWRFMEKEIRSGHQCYVICPMVEENEALDCENVTDYTRKLRQHFGSEFAVEALHGRMKGKQKNDIMSRFAAGEIQILVSTTVIEVGVDVPNATVMLIENAERFGLAQLHQLRGRVGRGRDQSYCIFLQGSGPQEITARLEILNHSNDGFEIAEQDLRLRGPGDLFGVRQSGEALFSIGDIYQDQMILKAASAAAADLLALDPELSLPQNRQLAVRLEERMKSGEE